MAYLLDTNVLVRLANGSDAQHPTAVQAVLNLHRRGEALYVTPQVMIESTAPTLSGWPVWSRG